ncbi:MAG: InlB B-repeat-containing protein, partial [Oscillospiraceae bacterium]|nr:InlB B-repeat-containing protein [Oscillospiraceae bacterium]
MKLKRLLAFVLAFAMMFSLGTPAYATGDTGVTVVTAQDDDTGEVQNAAETPTEDPSGETRTGSSSDDPAQDEDPVVEDEPTRGVTDGDEPTEPTGGDVPTVTKYTVTFDSDGGSAVAAQEVEEGQTATKPADPTRDNYEFLGWLDENWDPYDFDTPVTADIELTAEWKVIVAAKIGDTPYATLGAALDAAQTGDTIKLQADYDLADDEDYYPYYTSDAGFDSVTFDLGGHTLRGYFNIDAGSVTIKNGDTDDTNFFVSGNGVLTIAADTVVGNDVSVEENGTLNVYGTINSDVTAGNSATVNVFDGGKLAGENQGIDVAEQATLNVTGGQISKVFVHGSVKNGESAVLNVTGGKVGEMKVTDNFSVTISGGEIGSFEQWKNLDSDACEASITGGTFTGTFESDMEGIVSGGTFAEAPDPAVLAAGYELHANADGSYTARVESWDVTFDADNGTDPVVVAVAKGSAVAEPEAPTKDGYKFKGWYLNGAAYDFNTVVTADITLTAQWQEVVYTVQVGETKYETLAEAVAAANSGDTVKLLADIVLTDGYNSDSSTGRFPIGKSLTIDGDGKQITVSKRGFGVGVGASEKIDVTFKDVTIINTSAQGRCIDTRGNLNSLTLDGVTLKTPNTATQPLTIGGSQSTPATVTIRNSTIQTMEDGSYGYAITTFNPVNMTVTGSTIKGWACFNIKGPDGSAGSAGSVITVTGSTLESTNIYSGASNAFGLVKIEDDNVSVSITGSTINVNGANNTQAIVSYDSDTLTDCVVELGSGNNVTLEGAADFVTNAGDSNKLLVSGGTFNVEVPEDVCAAGFAPKANGDGTYSVVEVVGVTFDPANGGEATKVLVEPGQKVAAPEDPTWTGKGYFLGWYDGETAFDFDTAITGAKTLTARWLTLSAYETTLYVNDLVEIAVNNFDLPEGITFGWKFAPSATIGSGGWDKATGTGKAYGKAAGTGTATMQIKDSAGTVLTELVCELSVKDVAARVDGIEYTTAQIDEAVNAAIAGGKVLEVYTTNGRVTLNEGETLMVKAADNRGQGKVTVSAPAATAEALYEITSVKNDETGVTTYSCVNTGTPSVEITIGETVSYAGALNMNKVGTYKLLKDLTVAQATASAKGAVTLDLNGKTLTVTGDEAGIFVYPALTGTATTLTITGDGKVVVADGADAIAVWASRRGEVIIENGEFVGAAVAVYTSDSAKVTVNGGTFKVNEADKTFVLNRQDGSASTITVNYGTFYGFDPANNAADGANTNYVTADNKIVVADDAAGTYTVYDAVTVTFDADNADDDSDVTTVEVGKGTAVAAPDPAPTKEGFAFAGWYLDVDDEEPYDFSTPVAGDITLTAVWAAYVAKVGDEVFTSLAEAINAVENGGTIELLAGEEPDGYYEDIFEADIPAGASFTIDLGGNYLSGSIGIADATVTIRNGLTDSNLEVSGGTLTIASDVVVENSPAVTGTGTLNIYGTVTYGINVTGDGTLNVYDGAVIHDPESAVEIEISSENGTVNVYGGQIDAIFTAADSPTVNIEGGEIGSVSIGQSNVKSTLTVSGGKIGSLEITTDAESCDASITGGEIGSVSSDDVVGFITGGTFGSEIPEELCAEGYALKDNGDGTYSVVGLVTVTFDTDGGSEVAPVQVLTGETVKKPTNPTKAEYVFGGWYLGETAYDFSTPVTEDITLTATWTEAAIEYTSASGAVSYSASLPSAFSSGTYKLLKDVTRTTRMAPGILASNVTLDLNGHTLTSTASDCGILLSRAGTAASHKSFAIVDTSDAKGGKLVVSASASAAIQAQGKYNDITIGEGVTIDGGCVAVLSENQTLTVNGTINGGDDFAIATNGSSTKDATININEGAVLTSNITAVYLPGTGTTNVSGGSITGATAIYQKSGTLNVSGGTITGTGAAAEYTYNGNGANATGDAIVVDSCGYPGGTPTTAITGGTITSASGAAIGDYVYGENEAADVTSTNPELALNEGWKWVENGAVYKAAKFYTVTFVNGEEELEVIEVLDGEAVAEPDPAPTKEGHTFAGWFLDESETAYDFTAPVTGSITLTAKWDINTYTVTFDSNGGSEVAAQTVEHGQTATEPETPTREGPYVFSSWQLNGKKFAFTTPITEDIVLTAKWTDAVAKVDDTYYTSLSAAISAVKGTTGKTIVLVKDLSLTGVLNRFTLGTDQDFTLDMGGHTLTMNGAYTTLNGAKLTVTNGTMLVKGNMSQQFIVNSGELTITESATIQASGTVSPIAVFGPATVNTAGTLIAENSFAIAGNGSAGKGGYTINVTGGTVSSANAPAIYHPNTGTVNVTGGTVTGTTAIYQKAGTLNVSGGTITATGTAADYTYNGNGANATGDAIVVDSCGYPGGTPTTAITGGTITSANGAAIGDYVYGENEAADVTSTNPELELNEGWKWIEDGAVYKAARFHVVTFDIDGVQTTAEVVEGEAVAKPEDPAKTGHTFAGWTLNDAAYDFTAPVTEDITLTAKWDINEYAITYVVDGEEYASYTLAYGSETTKPADPTKTNYIFTGWTPEVAETVTEDATYTATWKGVPRTVIYMDGMGNILALIATEYGAETPELPSDVELPTERAGYRLADSMWTPDIAETVNGNAVYMLNWIPVVTVTLVNDEAVSTVTIDRDTALGDKLPADLTKEGSSFLGWFDGNNQVDADTVITASVTLTAKWEINKYTITFVVDGVETSSQQAYGTETVKPADPTKEGSTFLGWTPAVAATVTGDATYTATWAGTVWTLTTPYTPSATVTADGATFNAFELVWYAKDTSVGRYQDGWWVGMLFTAPDAVTAENIAATTYSNNGGETWKSFNNAKDSKPGEFPAYMQAWLPVDPASVETAINDGTVLQWTYKFAWDGNQATAQTFVITVDPQNVTLTKDGAVEIKTVDGEIVDKNAYFNVTFDAAGGSEVDAQSVRYNTAAAKPADPTREGYRFLGWYVGETAYDFTAPVTADVALTAKWEYTVWTMTAITDNANGVNGASQIIFRDTNAMTANWSAKDEEAGRTEDGWWFGVKFTAPSAGIVESATYTTNGSAAKSFKQFKDGEDWMGAWGFVNEEIVATALQHGGYAGYTYIFYND